MKNLVIISAVASLFFSACKTSQLASYSDDVYANPAEDKRMAKLAAEQQAKKDAENRQKLEQDRLAQQAKDDANPLYKDPSTNQDDYYDYKYASRVKRFNQPINGAGYYDNYYTNQYYYNQNPSCYGTSIYSGYGNMPSNQFSNYSTGVSMCFGYGMGNSYNNPYGYCGNSYGYNYNPYYNPYGYNSYGSGYSYNPYGYNNYYGSNYGYGYNSGYYGNSFNNGGWGYLNGHDPNSNYANMSIGPRGSNGGNNGGRSSSAGMAVPEDLQYNSKTQFFQSVIQQQESTPRFTEVVKPIRTVNQEQLNSGNINYNTAGQTNSNPRNTTTQNENLNTNSTSGTNTSNTPRSGGFLSGFFNNNNSTSTVNEPSNSTPRSNSGTKVGASGIENSGNTNTNSTERSNNSGWNSWPSNSGSSGGGGGNSGGTSTPRSGGSGGGGRPR